MKLLQRIFPSREKRTSLSDDRYFNDVLSSGSATGMAVTPDTARRCAAVIACIRVLSETIAHLPFILYRREGDNRIRDVDHPLYRILHDTPNRWQTSFEFREMMMGHVLLRGNAYAQKVYDGGGTLLELVPLNPLKVTPKMSDGGEVYYEFKSGAGSKTIIPYEQMFHLKGYASDGLVGISPIAEARETIGLSLAAEEFGARTFLNDAQPGGVLEHPGKIGEEAVNNLRKSIGQQHTGVANARKFMILEEGMKWSRIGMTSSDTQWIETRKFQIEEIARIFRVPPHLIGHLERATFSNIEHQGLEFVTHTILPWLRRWEQTIAARLMKDEERRVYYSEFLVDGLLRGDINARYQAYAVGRQWGWLSADDVRKFENMDSLPNGNGAKYLIPLNMTDAAKTTSQEEIAETRQFVGDHCFGPALRALYKRYSERIQKSTKPFETHRNVIREGIEPVVVGLLLLNEVDMADRAGERVVSHVLAEWENKKLNYDDLVRETFNAVKAEAGLP